MGSQLHACHILHVGRRCEASINARKRQQTSCRCISHSARSDCKSLLKIDITLQWRSGDAGIDVCHVTLLDTLSAREPPGRRDHQCRIFAPFFYSLIPLRRTLQQQLCIHGLRQPPHSFGLPTPAHCAATPCQAAPLSWRAASPLPSPVRAPLLLHPPHALAYARSFLAMTRYVVSPRKGKVG